MEYELKNGNETVLTDLVLDHFELVGQTSIVTIKCLPESGLAFKSIGEVVLKNISFHNCGANQVSSSRNNDSFIHFMVAVYMLNCSSITLEHVHINSSNGTGLTIYDPQESVEIIDSVFADNSQKGQAVPGGGGLQIEFTFCSPGSSICTNDYDKSAVSDVRIVINNTNFTSNSATQGKDDYEGSFFYNYKAHNGKQHNFAFGRGGGLSIIFKGITNDISVNLNGVNITGNMGTFGSGFYVAIHDNAHGNTLTFKDVTLHSNINSQLPSSNWSIDGSGGGGKIILSGQNLNENTILISNCLFDSNKGIAGGGLSLEINLDERKKSSGRNNSLTISKTKFTNNAAFLGAAAYFSQEVLSACAESCVFVFLENLLVNSNMIYCNLTKNLIFSLPCSGVLYSTGVSLALNSWNNFTNNVGSAIELHTTYANIKSKTSVNFVSNSAVNGGAMALYDCSYIVIGDRTVFNFTNNKADVLGGAIFSDVCTSNNQPTTLSSKCFLQYYNSYVHPNNWNSTFHFESNTIRMPPSYSNSSSLYAANAISCWYPEYSNDTLSTTFCWSRWHYKPGKCHNHIDSAAAFIQVDHSGIVPAIPGGQTKLPITVLDGTGGTARPGLIVCVHSGPAKVSSRSSTQKCKSTLNGEKIEDSIILYLKENESHVYDGDIRLSIITKGKTALQIGMSINFERCSWPLYLKNDQCVLIEEYFCCSGKDSCGCTMDCELNKLVQGKVLVKEKYGLCISRSADNNETHVGHCPLSYYDFSCKAYYNVSALRNGQCSQNRRGILCGQCKEGYSIPVNSIYLECKDCSHNSKVWGWSMFFLLQILPETLMILLIVIFNLKITNGSIGGYILYSQIVSINFPAWNYPAWLANLWLHNYDTSTFNKTFTYAAFPFSIWNLDFFTLTQDVEMCIGNKMSAIEVIAFQYIVIFYALALFLLLYVWIVMYHKGYSFVVCITRPIHQRTARLWQRMKIKPSLIDSLALIYILCFTQLTSISFKLLHYSTDIHVYENNSQKVYFYDGNLKYFQSYHAIHGSLAIVVLFFLVALPTFLLLVYQFRQTQRALSFLRLRREGLVALVDTLTGPFRNSTKKLSDFRYFTGLFLLFRIALLSTYFISYKGKNIIPIVQLFLTGITAGAVMIIRPYTKNIHNLTNFLLLLVLAALIILTYVPIRIAVYVIIPVMYAPLLFAIAYCLIWVCKKSLLLFIPNKMSINIINNSGSRSMSKKIKSFFESSNRSSRSLPDRMIHPEDYDERHVEVHDNDDDNHSASNSTDEGEDQRLLLVASTYDSDAYGSNANSRHTENIN